MQDTPRGLRLHIGLFGRRNAGKSSLINALTGQSVSIVSDTPGTTTDPVEKPIEMAPIGPVLFVDTAGIDDDGALGAERVRRTGAILERVDLALLVIGPDGFGPFETRLAEDLRARATPTLVVVNKSDLGGPEPSALAPARDGTAGIVAVSALTGDGIDALKRAIARLAPETRLEEPRLVGDLVPAGELAVLVVPIDLGAPKGRLILPQIQVIRELLDSDAMCVVVKERELPAALARLDRPPKLVICDSQIVLKAAADTPAAILLTTFSILMARFKGDLNRLAAGAAAIERLRPGDRVLIGETCGHHPLADDIGRVKIPRWLNQYAGGGLKTEVAAGKDFPDDLTPYSLIVQCGGCTVTRRHMLARLDRAQAQGVAMTNYGVAISLLQGVLPRTLECFPAARAAFERAREMGR